jgi:hypothetical protein
MSGVRRRASAVWRIAATASLACALLVGVPGLALAQSMPTGQAPRAGESPVRPHTIEVSAFAGWIGSGALSGQSALLTRDMIGNPPPGLALFSVATRQKAASSFGGRIAYNLTRMFAVEGAFAYSHPTIRATISGDPAAPAVAPFTLAQVSQISGDVSGIAHLTGLVFANGHGVPFLAAGGGYLRQVFSGSSETVNGQIYNVGGGVKYFIGGNGRAGVRADAREYLRRPGPDGTKTRANFSLSGSVLFVF